MTGTPNPDEFLTYHNPREYEAEVDVTGTVFLKIFADSQTEAEQILKKMMHDEDECFLDLNDVNEFSNVQIGPAPKMFLATDEDGRPVRTARLTPGLKPRQPNENGF